MCIIISCLVPLFKYVALHKNAMRGTKWFDLVDTVVPRLLKPISDDANGSNVHGNTNRILTLVSVYLGLWSGVSSFGSISAFHPLCCHLLAKARNWSLCYCCN